MVSTFTGYRRENGRIGVRNYVAVIPTSVAGSGIASRIASEAGAWARATPHQMGTTQPKETREQTERVLARQRIRGWNGVNPVFRDRAIRVGLERLAKLAVP